MNQLIRRICIKDLLIFQSPIIYGMISEYINSAKEKELYIGHLSVNPYIYETKSMDVSFLINYIKSLNNLAKIFRIMYDDEIYTLRLEEFIDDELYQTINEFHFIFDGVNNTFNNLLTNQFLFEDFSIYQSKTSLETCIALYNTFIDYFIVCLRKHIDPEKIDIINKSFNFKKIKFMPMIYDKIFEQFENIYLPFY